MCSFLPFKLYLLFWCLHFKLRKFVHLIQFALGERDAHREKDDADGREMLNGVARVQKWWLLMKGKSDRTSHI